MTSKQSENALALYGTASATPPNEPPMAETPSPNGVHSTGASDEAVTIELTAFETKVEPPQAAPMASDPYADPELEPDERPAWRKYLPLAASVAVAAVVGALAGAAAMTNLSRPDPATATTATLMSENRNLQERVVRLSSELTTIKAGIDAGNRAAVNQLGKITERLDRAEKAQTEPAARLAKIADSLDRLERRTATAGTPLPPPDVTGSVTSVEKLQSKPPVIEGWKLLDYYAGRAVLENRSGAMYEVGAGSNLPGVGTVETVKRIDGRVIVTTPKGIITSSLEPPQRPRSFQSRRY